MTEVLTPMTVAVNCDILGIDRDDIPTFEDLSVEMQIAASDDIPHLLDSFWKLYGYLEEIVTDHRPIGPGLIHDLRQAGASLEVPLTTSETVATLLGSLVGVDQNILSTVGKAAYILLARPELWTYLVTHPEAIPTATEELLRVLPLGTISTFPRIATRDVEVSGGTIRSGEVVVADAGRANLDPAVYPDPTSIDLTRQGPRHLQFGYGMHHRMGAAMARMEIAQCLRYLTARLPDLRLAVRPETVKWDTGVLVHRPRRLPVTTTPQEECAESTASAATIA